MFRKKLYLEFFEGGQGVLFDTVPESEYTTMVTVYPEYEEHVTIAVYNDLLLMIERVVLKNGTTHQQKLVENAYKALYAFMRTSSRNVHIRKKLIAGNEMILRYNIMWNEVSSLFKRDF